MKNMIMGVALFVSAVAFAGPQKEGKGVLEYTIKSGKFAPSHVQNSDGGNLTLDYTNKTVKLIVHDRPVCKPGMLCPKMIRVLSVELPITSVETDSCGIRTVVALKDQRPVDGIMQKLTVIDSSQLTCQTFVAVIPKAKYETASYDRKNGKPVEETSTMELSLQSSSNAEAEVLLKYQFNIGFSPDPTTMTLTIDAKGNVLSVVEHHRTKKVTRTEIAKLSNSVVAKLKQQLTTVPEDTKLVDDQEGKPVCMDAPVAQIVAYTKGQEIQIYESSGCHTYKSYDGEASSLANAVLGLTYLAKSYEKF